MLKTAVLLDIFVKQ